MLKQYKSSMQALKKSSKFLLLTVFVGGFFISSWTAVFAAAFNPLSFSPLNGSLINSNQPAIKIRKINLPGSSIKNVQLKIDGLPVEAIRSNQEEQVVLKLKQPLAEGRHDLKAVVSYHFIFNRQLTYSWHFTVDTLPPPLALANQETYIVTPNEWTTIQGVSEKGALISVWFNGAQLTERLKTKEDGSFSFQLKRLQSRNQLLLKASDKAGNSRALAAVVIKDQIPPSLKTLTPGEGETVRVQPQINASFNETETGIEQASLFIDDKPALTKGDDRSLSLTYAGPLLTEGYHQAKLVALDYAGNKLETQWRFNVDTRRIVINRAQKRLYFYQSGQLRLVFPVAVGMPQYPTPAGSWRIVRKEINPVWYNPGSDWAKEMPKKIPPGPTNPLGLRALALNAPGILIHGTSDVASIGRAASHGCIRMTNNDIIRFYPLVGIGVPVEIY